MGIIGTAIPAPAPAANSFAFIIGAEDNTAGTAYWTTDTSGLAHVDYSRVDVPLNGTTIGGTAYGTAGTVRNNMAVVAPTTPILNIFPNDYLTSVSIRRGRTRPDQWDDVGEMTITVNNQTGDSDPDNNNGRYKRLSTLPPALVTQAYGSWIKPGLYGEFRYQVSANGFFRLFTGSLETITPTDDRWSTATYVFTDALGQLGRTGLPNPTVAGASGDTTRQRLKNLLEQANLKPRISSNDGGIQTLLFSPYLITGCNRTCGSPSGDASSVLDACKSLVSGEAGRIAANTANQLVILDRSAMQAVVNNGVVATFTDSPGTVAGIGYDEIHTNQASAFVYNSSVVNTPSGSVATKRVESVNQYGERKYEVDTVLASGLVSTSSTSIDSTTVTAGVQVRYHTPKNHNLVDGSLVAISGLTTAQGLPASNVVRIYNVGPQEFYAAVTTGTTGLYTGLSGLAVQSSDANNLSSFLASNWAYPSTNVASISLNAYGASSSDLQTLFGIDLQQQVRVYRKLPGGRVLDVNVVVEGIEIDITPESRRFTFYFSPKDTQTY